MTGNSAVFNLRRSFAKRDGIDDLTARLSRSPRVPRCGRARRTTDRNEAGNWLFYAIEVC